MRFLPHDPLNYIEVNGVRLRRADCARCSQPVYKLGEAIRVDCPEDTFWTILHVCLACVRRSNLTVTRGEAISQARGEVQAA